MHGVAYDHKFLDSLPVLGEAGAGPPNSKIRVLSPAQFSKLHLNHLLDHPPDNVLFPFLHGLEGENRAQIQFFLSSHNAKIPVPDYRGLVCVVCDDDISPEHRKKLFRRTKQTDPDAELIANIVANGNVPGSSKLEYDLDDDDLDMDEEDEDGEAYSDSSESEGMVGVEAGASTLDSGAHGRLTLELGLPVPMDMDVDGGHGPTPADTSVRINQDPYSPTLEQEPGALGVGAVSAMRAETPGSDDVKDAKGIVREDTTSVVDDPNAASHMHPVQHRAAPVSPVPLGSSPTTIPHQAHHESSDSTSTSASTSAESDALGTQSSSFTSAGTLSELCLEDGIQTSAATSSPPPSLTGATRSLTPPLLTSTFRPSDLLRPVIEPVSADSSSTQFRSSALPNSSTSPTVSNSCWEFTPPRVPDGISLRNFGIQVPIYATISDIVIYSPKGASPAALALARRFAEAIRRKREERVARRRNQAARQKPGAVQYPVLFMGDIVHEEQKSDHLDAKPDEDELPEYNVFVLEADAAKLRTELPHLVVRVYGEGNAGGGANLSTVAAEASNTNEAQRRQQAWHASTLTGAHTDGTDGRIDEMEVIDAGRGTAPSLASGFGVDNDLSVIAGPNTVDFALREKEEMRDLTRASEIISVLPPSADGEKASPTPQRPWLSNVPVTPNAGPGPLPFMPEAGQVFLGNADDVPLALDPDGPMMHFHTGGPGFGASAGVWPPPAFEEGSEAGALQEMEVDTPGPDASDHADAGDILIDPLAGHELSQNDPFNYLPTNDPTKGLGFDICIECHDLAPFPTTAHLRAAEEHLVALETMWEQRCIDVYNKSSKAKKHANAPAMPPRPPPNANAVIHLPFPSSPQSNAATLTALLPVLWFLQRWLQPPPPCSLPVQQSNTQADSHPASGDIGADGKTKEGKGRRWSTVSSFFPSATSFFSSSSAANSGSDVSASASASRNRSLTAPGPMPGTIHAPQSPYVNQPSVTNGHVNAAQSPGPRTRPLKVLIYSNDGYTESSVPALCLLMAVRGIALPEAYLELQVAKKRSFFVYQADLGLLRRVEQRLRDEREREKISQMDREREKAILRERQRVLLERELQRQGGSTPTLEQYASASKMGEMAGIASSSPRSSGPLVGNPNGPGRRPAAKSVSFAQNPVVMPASTTSSAPTVLSSGNASVAPISVPDVPSVPSDSTSLDATSGSAPTQAVVPPSFGNPVKGRPRASTSPWLPSIIGDHQSWFNDPRFDGSFPSRVLPFLYLGNLNHATNAYMLHALGITHVVSVGECALVPPPHVNHLGHQRASSSSHGHFVPGKGPGGEGSLWIEEREGRIKVLDIQGVCDDGIDTLEPQLEPICEWIDKARAEGGQVLVHCRVGVSRSATVTIAYVMKHLGLPLVDAYLIVRSRRLSVLIQPNMRLLYNLCGWEVKLAKERAGEDENKLKYELSRTLSWPYLAKEVHALNEKYLH